MVAVAGREIGAGLGDADDRLARAQFGGGEAVVELALDIERGHAGIFRIVVPEFGAQEALLLRALGGFHRARRLLHAIAARHCFSPQIAAATWSSAACNLGREKSIGVWRRDHFRRRQYPGVSENAPCPARARGTRLSSPSGNSPEPRNASPRSRRRSPAAR